MIADITIDPVRSAQIEAAWKLAAEDARAGRDPQVLTGELADQQGEYDTAFEEELLAMASEKAVS